MESTETSQLQTTTLCLNNSEEIARLIADVLYNPSPLNTAAKTARHLLAESPVAILNICLNRFDAITHRHCCDEDNFLPIVLLQPEGQGQTLKPVSNHSPPSHAVQTNQGVANLQTATISCGPLSVDKIQRRAWCLGKECHLTPKEFELLWWFANHPQRAVTRRELVISIWGVDFEGYEHTVSNHINRLRKKLSQISDGKLLIETVWGVGYRLDSEAE